jgi:RNA polymerase sigma-70 factor, ECF subfamily
MAESRRKDTSERPSGPSVRNAKGSFASSLDKELHKLTVHKMRFERVGHTLQAAALIHEAYLKLAETLGSAWQDREHFLAVAARVMRHTLVDLARSHDAGKRGAGSIQVTFDENLLSLKSSAPGVLIIDQELMRFASLDDRQAKILELQFFAGMTFEETGSVLEISCRTLKRDWRVALPWLRKELSG